MISSRLCSFSTQRKRNISHEKRAGKRQPQADPRPVHKKRGYLSISQPTNHCTINFESARSAKIDSDTVFPFHERNQRAKGDQQHPVFAKSRHNCKVPQPITRCLLGLSRQPFSKYLPPSTSQLETDSTQQPSIILQTLKQTKNTFNTSKEAFSPHLQLSRTSFQRQGNRMKLYVLKTQARHVFKSRNQGI